MLLRLILSADQSATTTTRSGWVSECSLRSSTQQAAVLELLQRNKVPRSDTTTCLCCTSETTTAQTQVQELNVGGGDCVKSEVSRMQPFRWCKSENKGQSSELSLQLMPRTKIKTVQKLAPEMFTTNKSNNKSAGCWNGFKGASRVA